MLGYEEDITGLGVVGNFYDNEQMVGTPFEIKQDKIDFDWDSDPVENINSDNFSVRWETWIKVPVSG